MYSALKINGKKLYELAREGKTVERKPRPIRIHSINLIEYRQMEGLFTMDVTCSKGTYIRTLCHDIGEKLGCFGAMESLQRTRVGVFTLENALTLEQIEVLMKQNELEQQINTTCIRDLTEGQEFLVYDENCCFKAVYQKGDRDLRVRKMF